MFKLNLTGTLKILVLLTVSFHLSCSSNPEETKGDVKGVVKSIGDSDETIQGAKIVFENSVLATTNEDGEYEIFSLEEGTYTLTCSAENYMDTVEQVNVVGGGSTTHNFNLRIDESSGLIVGEFQDLDFFNNELQSNPDLSNWDSKQIYDAASGATICTKVIGEEVGERKVYFDDEFLGTSDIWGQYGFQVKTGTYEIRAECEGYKTYTQTITVEADSKTYLNFFLEKE